tara:strand:+ start:423 stop:647 length:225 start_codon:yes stop_codon:yes gene_type:complete
MGRKHQIKVMLNDQELTQLKTVGLKLGKLDNASTFRALLSNTSINDKAYNCLIKTILELKTTEIELRQELINKP